MGMKLGLKLSEDHRLRMSEKRVLRRILVPRMVKAEGGWRRMHNE
jgi:hypothetical protein